MMKAKKWIKNDRPLVFGVLVGVMLFIQGCSTASLPSIRGQKMEAKAEDLRVGADRDLHGCIASAGYQWCEKIQQCERPWELAKRQGLEQTSQAIKAFCEG